MTEVTLGWKHVAMGFEGEPGSLGGLNPWQLKWHSLAEPQITVAHPSYTQERHLMWIYELHAEGTIVKFAAGEFSNGFWGFYVPA